MSGDGFDQVRASMGRWQEEARGETVGKLEELFAEVVEQYRAFFARQPDLDEVRSYPHPRYGTMRASYADLVQHVVNHGTYHRGNISAMLRQMGQVGTPTDYAFYLIELSRHSLSRQ